MISSVCFSFYLKVFGKPFAPNIKARALGKFSDHLDLLSGPSFSRHLKRLSGRHQHQKQKSGHKHKLHGDQLYTGAKEGGVSSSLNEEFGDRPRFASSSSSVSGSRSLSGFESGSGSSRNGSEKPAEGYAKSHHHKRESNDQYRYGKQQESGADPGAMDKFYNRLEDRHGLRDLYKRQEPSNPSRRRRERKYHHHHEKQLTSSEEKALHGERSRSSSSSSSSSQRKKH